MKRSKRKEQWGIAHGAWGDRAKSKQKAAIIADSKNSAQNSRSWPIKIESDLDTEQFNFLTELTTFCIEAR